MVPLYKGPAPAVFCCYKQDFYEKILLKVTGHILQVLNDRQMLGADPFALAAGNTEHCAIADSSLFNSNQVNCCSREITMGMAAVRP